jgi:HAD superfamily hydrolase (TIGR01549 family)
VLVDFDDTLVDNSVVPETVERACVSIASVIDGLQPSKLLEANTAAWRSCWSDSERKCWLGEDDVLDVSRKVWRLALLDCGHEDEALVDFAFDTHQRIGREMDRLFGDVYDFLADVRSAGMLIALVTNSSSRSQRTRLSSLGLDGAFDHVVISGELGIAKPDPAIFHEALTRLQIPATSAWHVGDSILTDIAGAAAAGIRSVWLNRENRSRDANGPIPELEVKALDGLVGRLLQG